MLLMRTRLKGMDSLLKTWTKAVSYSRFRQCSTPRARPAVCTFVQESLLPRKQKRGRMMMGPRYSMQKTISHLICLPKFLTVRTSVGILATRRGISLSVSTCLASPCLYESSCWRTGTLVCFLISSLTHLMVFSPVAVMLICRSLQFMVRFSAISSISTQLYQFLYPCIGQTASTPMGDMPKHQKELFDVGKLSEASLRKYQSYFQIDATMTELKEKVKNHFKNELEVDMNSDIDAFLELKREEKGSRKRIARSIRPSDFD